jgi:hypothetical protein
MRRYLFLHLILLLVLVLTATAQAATYYVKATGNDSNTGLSDAQAWKTLSKVNNFNFATGDDVYLRCGDTWQQALTIDWSGTAANRVVVGAYYLNGSVETIGVSGSRPILDGNGTIPSWTGDKGQNAWGSLVLVTGNYVTVQDLEVKRSTGRGVNFDGETVVGGGSHGIARNLSSHNNFRTGVQSIGTTNTPITDILIESCDIYENAQDFQYPGWAYWSGALWTRNSSSITWRYNKVFHNKGEGIIVDSRSSNVLVEYNTAYDNPLQIYQTATKNVTIRYNLAYATSESTWYRWGDRGSGITITQEYSWADGEGFNTGYYIYGNLVAGCSPNFAVFDYGTSQHLNNTLVYNNTFIEKRSEKSALGAAIVVQNVPMSSSEFKNNIVFQSSGTIADIAPSRMAMDYNLWSQQPESDARGGHDLPYGNPRLVKSSGWLTVTGGSLDGSEFALQDTSPAIDAGVAFGSDYANIPDCSASNWKTGSIVRKSQASLGLGSEIGASVYDPNPLTPNLSPPNGLKAAALP